MTDPTEPVLRRTELTFSIEGLSAREELLLKSLVRLLSFKTQQHWLYSADSLHLRVQADSYKAQPGASICKAQQVLILGIAAMPRQGFLCLPLRAHELEVELNRIGALIGHTTLAAQPSGALDAPSVLVQISDVAEPLQGSAQKLRQWPPPHLLAQPGRVRLATLLTGRPLTLEQLQRISGHSLLDCKNFLADLAQAKLLTGGVQAQAQAHIPAAQHTQQVASSSAHAPPSAPSLFARIRLRLGLQTAGSHG